MELVSVVKMQKAVSRNLSSRKYTDAGTTLLTQVCYGVDPTTHPLLASRASAKKLVIVITSDRGLCGALNTRVIKEALLQAEGAETDFIAIGKKSRDYLLNHKYSLIASYLAFGDQLRFERIQPIVQQITSEYLADHYGQVVVVYTHFESSLSQVAKVSQLLPFETNDCGTDSDSIIFDPSKSELVSHIVPRMMETQLWQYILESAASEHSARMVAMKNANENAEDLIFDLTLSFNQTRQAGITREIAEISAGKMTLEG